MVNKGSVDLSASGVTIENIGNSDAIAMSAYIMQSDGQMKIVQDDTEDHRNVKIPPFRCFECYE